MVDALTRYERNERTGSPRPRRSAGIGDHRAVLHWTRADEEAFARSVLRRRWLNAVGRAGVVMVAELRALSGEQLRETPNLGPVSVADISVARGDVTLRCGDPIELLALLQARAVSERHRR